MTMLRRFEGKAHADDYAQYRPEWPPVIFDNLVAYLKDGGGTTQLAVDVGCGTGISTRLLAEKFEKVIGVDISKAMISQATKDIPNITYQVCKGEDLGFLPDESVDAITCASSIHWLDMKKFYKEVDRILKPGGVLASFKFCEEHLVDNSAANELLDTFYKEILSKYFDQPAYDSIYTFGNLEQPYKDFIRYLDLSLEKTWPMSDFLGYLSTVSAARKIIDSGGTEFDQFATDLLATYKHGFTVMDKDRISFEDISVTTKWDIKLNLSRKPR